MPDTLIDYATKHLTIFDAGLAIVVVSTLLLQRPRRLRLWWGLTMLLMAGLTMVLSRIATMLYQDPRQFTAVHLSPLTPFVPFLPHLARNSFPSGHAVLTGLIVASVLFVSTRWTVPFVIMGILDVWVRVGMGAHQAIDILGGWAVVAIATAVAFPAAAIVTAIVLPWCQSAWGNTVLYLHRRVAVR